MNYYVLQKIDDKGRVRCTLYTAEQAANLGYQHGYRAETPLCDIYVDGFATKQDALDFIRQAKAA